MSDEQTPDDPVLSAALRTAGLREANLERVRMAVAREWRAAAARRTRWIACAAAALGAVAVVLLMTRTADQAAVVGALSKVNDGGVEASSGFFRHRTLAAGEALHAGDRLTARGAALMTLARGGSLRVAPGSTLKMPSPTQISLERGLIYLDIPAGAPNPARSASRTATPARLMPATGRRPWERWSAFR